jgi:ribosome biogenesis protein BRX1
VCALTFALTHTLSSSSISFAHSNKTQIWIRNYQIVNEQPTNALEAHRAKKQIGQADKTSLVEIGPRFVLNTIRIFRGSFGGPTLYQNPDFVSPNAIRALEKKRQGQEFDDKKRRQVKREERVSNIVMPEDPLASVFR